MARPRIIKNSEELYAYWLEYTAQVNPKVEYTVVAFTNYLRKNLKDFRISKDYFYQLNEEFSITKKIIDQEIEERANYLLAVDFHGGRVFYHKNKLGWVDKKEVEQTNKNIEINIKKASEVQNDN